MAACSTLDGAEVPCTGREKFVALYRCYKSQGQPAMPSGAAAGAAAGSATGTGGAAAAPQIRPAVAADVAAVVDCINAAFEIHPGDLDYSTEGSTGRTDAAEIQACVDDPRCHVWCCCEGAAPEVVVGAVVMNQASGEHGRGASLGGPVLIGMLSTRPSHQRKGIARALVRQCETQAAVDGYTAVHAEVINLLTHLQDVYTAWVRPPPAVKHNLSLLKAICQHQQSLH